MCSFVAKAYARNTSNYYLTKQILLFKRKKNEETKGEIKYIICIRKEYCLKIQA